MNGSTSCSLFLYTMCFSLRAVYGPLLDSIQYVPVFHVLESPKMDTLLHMQSHKCYAEKDDFSEPAGYSLANTAENS